MVQDPSLENLIPPYRILDLTDESGVFCTKLLADFGAEVIRIEPPAGDSMRGRGPFAEDQAHRENSLPFLFFNTNKKSITLDLEKAEGRALLRRLAERADALVECFPVGYLKGLGLDYETFRQINPQLVMASITPFGQNGPWSGYKSSDLIAMAASGYMQITGQPDEPPVRQGNLQSMYPGAQYAAAAIMGALYHRDIQGGEGQHIDVSLQEALITYYTDAHPALAWERLGQNVTRVGNTSTLVVPLGAYPCQDGWICAGVITPREWDTLAEWIHEVTGNDEILSQEFRGATQDRAPHNDLITAYFMDFTSRFTSEELFHEGQKRNLVFLPVNDVPDLLTDPQLEAGNFWADLQHDSVGRVKHPLGVFFSKEVAPKKVPSPTLGQHNQEVYGGALGITASEIQQLKSRDVI